MRIYALVSVICITFSIFITLPQYITPPSYFKRPKGRDNHSKINCILNSLPLANGKSLFNSEKDCKA